VIALSITALAKSFVAGAPGCTAHVSVLRDLDLALWPGEIVAVDGAEGSGKSTLLKCAAGLLRPDAGSIRWCGARVCPRDVVAYVGAEPAAPPLRYSLRRDAPRDRGRSGALYAALSELSSRTALILVDDLPRAGALERRLALALLRDYSLSGAAILVSANEEVATAPFITRVVTLADGALAQRRKRSAARIAASSLDSRARARARSTYGRSLRSPQ
jgi:ABC-type cobalamin/Fe3+-siderophores transport system ATPase subunit